ncbi:DUF4834 family protein [Aggregatimonas sangjinii]|uniref:DUF4834 family protein n=1 Tax=Aggregatimonas sangjinii TaxID=2583587 RepID=A0A5B7ST01_9FLAO|nr:DUF4834 family protein [Aggregatimonas sangjinii]QCX00148.1 DUF4834 family protein [Aggregatimonas sangjinii]
MAFLKTILIILLVYYGLKILLRMFAPKIMGYAAKKTEQHFRERFGEFTNAHQGRPTTEGEVVIEKQPNKGRQSKDTVGEYIDFEEID